MTSATSTVPAQASRNVATLLVRYGRGRGAPPRSPGSLDGGTRLPAPLLLGVHTSGRLYQTRLGLSILEDLPRLTGRWLATLGILLVLAPVLGADRRQVIALCVVAVLAVMGLRALSYSTVRRLRATQFVAHPTLIVGASRTGRHVATILREHPEYGPCPRGFLEAPSGRRDGLPLPVLGAPAEMVQVMEEADTRVAVLAHGRCTESDSCSGLADATASAARSSSCPARTSSSPERPDGDRLGHPADPSASSRPPDGRLAREAARRPRGRCGLRWSSCRR